MLRVIALVVVIVLPVAGGRAQAGFMVYTDRTQFLSDAADAGLTTTNEDLDYPGPGDPFTIDDLNGNSVEFDVLDGIFGGNGIAGGAGDVKLDSNSVTGSVVELASIPFTTSAADSVRCNVWSLMAEMRCSILSQIAETTFPSWPLVHRRDAHY